MFIEILVSPSPIQRGHSLWVPALELEVTGETMQEAEKKLLEAIQLLAFERGISAFKVSLARSATIFALEAPYDVIVRLALFRARTARGQTIEDVAQILQTTRSSYRQYESGRRVPTARQFERILNRLHLNLDLLLSDRLRTRL